MNAKQVVGFLCCKSAFSRRNISSILLVAVFFGVYVMAGGKITTGTPGLRSAPGLGGNTVAPGSAPALDPNQLQQQEKSNLTPEKSAEVLGLVPSKERAEREESQNNKYKLFNPEDSAELEKEPVNREGLIKGAVFGPSRREQIKLERQEKKQGDMLEEIEKRLKMRSSHNY